MIRTPQARIFVALGVLALTMGEARAQISILERPVSGGVSVVQTIPYSNPLTRSYPCVPPDFKASLSLDPTNFPGEYGGALEAGGAGISGAISKRETWQFNSTVDAQSSYVMNVFAEAVPGSTVRLRFQGSYQIGWSTGNVLENHAGFLFTPESGTAINGGVVKGGGGSPSANDLFAVDLKPSSVYSTTEGGRTYYKLGNFNITGRGVLGSTNSGESVSYRAGISNIQAYYIGPTLMLNDGSGQTGLVGKGLPKSLSVKVSDGETGAAVSGVQITFTIAEPSNGAKFANGLTTIVSDTVEGIASASLILGSTAGPYTVKATCPADTCTSGMKEVAFGATAVLEENALELRKLSGDGAMTAGKPSLNPLRVQAFNTLAGAGKPGVDVVFSIVSTPVGGEDASLGASGALTDANGVAKTSFTLGTAEGDYVVKAVCDNCQVNREVNFSIAGRVLVGESHASAESERTIISPPAVPEGIGGVQIAFQNESMSPSFRRITMDNSRIGALKGDKLSFKAVVFPENTTLVKSDYVWSGLLSATGKDLSDVLLNNVGTFDLALSVKGTTRRIRITVAEIDRNVNFWGWLKSHPEYAGGVMSCVFNSLVWAGGGHNDVSDAMRHVYWNACVSNTISPDIASIVANAYEGTYPNLHNEHVMDFENNSIGRNIGQNFPYLIGMSLIPEEIKAVSRNGVLTVIDDPQNTNGEGLLVPSK